MGKQANNNDVVILHLDRPRELRYGHKALKQLGAITGKGLEDLEAGGVNFDDIEKYLYCGLLSDARKNGETLLLEQMEDLLDMAPRYGDIIEGMQMAFESAFGSSVEGNDLKPVAPAAQTKATRKR